MEKYCRKYNRSLSIDRAVYQLLLGYKWPGNVRELQNTIESAVVMCEGKSIGPEDMPDSIKRGAGEGEAIKLPESMQYGLRFGTLREEIESFEKHMIMQTIKECGGDKNKAMEILGLPRRTFYRKIAKFGTK